jgi:multidrug resistance efflux pump
MMKPFMCFPGIPGADRARTSHVRWLGLLLLLTWTPSFADSVTGRVEFAGISHLDFGVSGEVALVSVHPGDRVLAGTLLMSLDDSPFTTELEAAAAEMAWRKASMEEVVRGWERDNELYAEGSLSAVELELSNIARLRAEADYRRSVAVHVGSQSRLNRSRIVAPEAGIVLERNANPGERINMETRSRPAVVFATTTLVVRAMLGPGSVPLPAPGQAVELVAGEQSQAGRVQSVLPAGDGERLAVTVTTEGTLPPPGSSVELRY